MVCAAMAVVLWAQGAAAGTVAQPAKFLHRYGYYEARFRLQKMPGWWSAFWMQTETPSPRRGRGACGGEALRAGVVNGSVRNARTFRGRPRGPSRPRFRRRRGRRVRSPRQYENRRTGGRGAAGGADAFEACTGTKTGDQEIFYPKNGSLNFV